MATVASSAKRVLNDNRSNLNKKGMNPPRCDTVFLNFGGVGVTIPNGDVSFIHLLPIPPQAQGVFASATSKLINFYVAVKSAEAYNLDFKNLVIQRVPFNSGGNSWGTADATSGAGNESVVVEPETAFYDVAQTAGDHRMADATAVMLVHRKVLASATQLQLKPLDILLVTLTFTGATGNAVATYSGFLEISRLSV